MYTHSSFNPDHLTLHPGPDIPVDSFDRQQVNFSGEQVFEVKCKFHEIIKGCLPMCEFDEHINIASPFLLAAGKRTESCRSVSHQSQHGGLAAPFQAGKRSGSACVAV